MQSEGIIDMKIKTLLIGGLIVAGGISAYAYFSGGAKGLTAQDFEMITIAKGPVIQQVTASGKIQPVNTVSVGTQVSGIIEQVLVDYNDEVQKDQLLAKLDTAVLQETKNDAKAQLDLAKAKLKVAKLNYERFQKLYKDKLIAKADLEDAEVNFASAEAQELSALAAYNKAERNYGYATIVSPVSGTVISKEVEEGQTVAASLQTPTLFTIAEDLSKMQIEASIAEADIGMIVPEMPVTFTVDAYPNDTFHGAVRQVRLSPTEESNVVMYTVVIEVDNSSRKLLPGMTAFVNIVIENKPDVLRLPTSAMQFKPNATVRQFMDKNKIDLKTTEAVVYQFKNGKVVPVVFVKGLTDTSWIEIQEGLKAGDQVITEFIQKRRK